jgi:hypothetical protein
LADLRHQGDHLLVQQLVLHLQVVFLRDELAEVHPPAQQRLHRRLHLLHVVLQLPLLHAPLTALPLLLSHRPGCTHPALIKPLLLLGKVQLAEDEFAGGVQLQFGSGDGLRTVLGETGDAVVALGGVGGTVPDGAGLAGGRALEGALLAQPDGLVGLVGLDGLVAHWVAEGELKLPVRLRLLPPRHFHVEPPHLELPHHRSQTVTR